MSYIAPNSTIYLYNNIELDDSYKDTLYFSTITAQNNYFTNTKPYKYAYTNQMYTRTARGTIRINTCADYLYDCNYMRFQNNRTSNNKWFYAFITNVIYINENVSELTFAIDVMQTYLFDVRFEQSFVERCHSETDGVYDNLVAEDLYCGDDYVVANGNEIGNDNGISVVKKTPNTGFVLTSKVLVDPDAGSPEPETPRGCVINGMPAVVGGYSFSLTEQGFTYLYRYLRRLNSDNIISAMAIPSELLSLIPSGAYSNDGSISAEAQFVTDTHYAPARPDTFSGYTPRNKKLYNYPYNILVVSNSQGETAEYKYELFPYGLSFRIDGVLLPNPTYICYPTNYRGMLYDFDNAVTLTNFPSLPISKDAYANWLNQNRAGITASMLSTTLGMMLSGLGGVSGMAQAGYNTGWGFNPTIPNVKGGGVAGYIGMNNAVGKSNIPYSIGGVGVSTPDVNQITNQWSIPDITDESAMLGGVIGKFLTIQRMPNSVAGQISGSGIMAGLNKYQFTFYNMQIKREYAEIIDSYFDMFGYKQNKIRNINPHARALWSYVKTKGCNVINMHIDLPNDGANAGVLSMISAIHDKGITYWNVEAGVAVGDYSRASENIPI